MSLTLRELQNTIRDLVGVQISSSQGLPAEQYLDGFNNLAGNLVFCV